MPCCASGCGHELRQIQQHLGITTIFVTHDQDEAFEMSDRVVLLNNGRVVQICAAEELYDNPASRFAAEFIGEINVIEASVVAAEGSSIVVEAQGGERFRALAGDCALQAGEPVDVMIRPERLDLTESPPADGQGILTSVRKRVFSGDRIDFRLISGNGLDLHCRKPSAPPYRDLQEGAPIWVVPGACRVLPRSRQHA